MLYGIPEIEKFCISKTPIYIQKYILTKNKYMPEMTVAFVSPNKLG